MLRANTGNRESMRAGVTETPQRMAQNFEDVAYDLKPGTVDVASSGVAAATEQKPVSRGNAFNGCGVAPSVKTNNGRGNTGFFQRGDRHG